MCYTSTRNKQRQVAEAYLSGWDVFLSAPTGSGKSFLFKIAPYAFDLMASSNSQTVTEDAGSVCLVVVPLVALMNDQVDSLRARLSAACVGS